MLGQQNEDPMTSPMRPLRAPSRSRADDDERSRDSSEPPPPMPGTEGQAALARAERAVGKSREAMNSADDAATLAGTAAADAAAARAGVTEIKAQIGNSPDPVLGVPGRGLFGAFATLVADVHLVGAKVDGLVAVSAADRAAIDKAAEARRGSSARLVGWVVGPTIALLVGAIFTWLAGFHR